MKFRKRYLIYLAGGTLLAASVVACNHGMYFGSAEERGEWMVQKVSKELELNETQRARLTAVKDEFLDMRMAMRSDRAQVRQDLMTMLEQPTLDRDKANSIVDQKLAMINSRSPEIIDTIGDFYDSLDQNQRAQLRSFIEHKIDHHHRHRHWH